MENSLGKRGSPDWEDAERDMTVQRGCGRDRGRCRCRRVRGAISIIQENVRQSAAGRA